MEGDFIERHLKFILPPVIFSIFLFTIDINAAETFLNQFLSSSLSPIIGIIGGLFLLLGSGFIVSSVSYGIMNAFKWRYPEFSYETQKILKEMYPNTDAKLSKTIEAEVADWLALVEFTKVNSIQEKIEKRYAMAILNLNCLVSLFAILVFIVLRLVSLPSIEWWVLFLIFTIVFAFNFRRGEKETRNISEFIISNRKNIPRAN